MSEEDGMESIAHRFLSAAVKVDLGRKKKLLVGQPPIYCLYIEARPV